MCIILGEKYWQTKQQTNWQTWKLNLQTTQMAKDQQQFFIVAQYFHCQLCFRQKLGETFWQMGLMSA